MQQRLRESSDAIRIEFESAFIELQQHARGMEHRAVSAEYLATDLKHRLIETEQQVRKIVMYAWHRNQEMTVTHISEYGWLFYFSFLFMWHGLT